MATAGTNVQTLASSEDYFRQIVKPNIDAFFNAPSTFASAINLATSLYHFHEWLFDEFAAAINTHLGATFSSKGKFWSHVEATNAKFGYIRDVTNASKHVRIGGGKFRPSTGMTHIANTSIISVSWGQGGFGQGAYGGGPNVVFDDGGNQISFR
ncbi:hypothetical protein [Rhizobium leguminosarum]|uniref:Uncharacterized protein n=1 Tax=Rhizobium leguminosarum TaxID=384 RepID=A0A7M3DW86_RHILE|nr:hypothetical protein [Rhizobium leguminosarum]TAY52951.1 hypothetical protein ELH90_15605 [Rhizobium leguminosarum]